MKDYEDEKFGVLMAMLSTAVGIEVSKPKVELYFTMLKDIEFEVLERAFFEIINTRTEARGYLFPMIGDIRKKVFNCEDDKIEADAIAAWGLLCQNRHREISVNQEGEKIKASFDIRVIKKFEIKSIDVAEEGLAAAGHVVESEIVVIEIPTVAYEAMMMAFGAWEEFQKRPERDDSWDRAHFIRCYKSLAIHEQKRLLLAERPMKLLKE